MVESEAQNWTCRICGSEALLGAFEHCPNCRHERDWDDDTRASSSFSPDRFWGDELHCCGKGYSEAARFCGTCGARLRKQSQRRPQPDLPGSEPVFFAEEAEEDRGPTLVPFLALGWLADDDEAGRQS